MTIKERDRLWALYTITNKMGGRSDYTAISDFMKDAEKKELKKIEHD